MFRNNLTEMEKRWLIVVFYTAILIASLPYIRCVWNLTGDLLGTTRKYLILGMFLGVAGAVYCYRNLFFLFSVIVVIAMVYRFVPIIEERIHFIEYGILGCLVWWALGKRKLRWAIALGYILIISVLDEVIQGILPNRYYDTRDLVMNAVGGCIGLVIAGFPQSPDGHRGTAFGRDSTK